MNHAPKNQEPANRAPASREPGSRGITRLQLSVLDSDGIDMLSAHLQDALTCCRDIAWRSRERRFALMVNRFRWEQAAGSADKVGERICCGLHFDGVEQVKTRGIVQDDPARFLHLLAIRFEAGTAPGGIIRLFFAGGSEIRLSVEAVDAHLNDMGDPWPARQRPQHEMQAIPSETTP